jgi:arylsulfatase B
MIENIDENMGRLATFLRGRNLAENTIVIFTTDNGTASGAQVHSAGMRASKGSAYEGGHRVPFFIHWPAGGLTGGKTIRRLAAHIDILPTLIELCGLKRPKGPEIHGKSLRPLLEDPEAAWPDRALVVDSQRLDRLVKWRQAAVMTDRWRLVNPSPDGNPVRLELYDMSVDPQQSRDISKQHLDVVTHLSAEYERWWAKVSVRAGEYVRIRLGDARESPSRLTCHDWHGDGVEKVWNQAGIRSAPAVEGFWAVEVSAGGVYQFELRRWPEEVDLAINAPYRDNVFNRERASGVAISAVRAGVKIGRMEQVVPVREGDKAAVLRMRLSKGPFELRAWFEDREGTRRGAYFAYITKIS